MVRPRHPAFVHGAGWPVIDEADKDGADKDGGLWR